MASFSVDDDLDKVWSQTLEKCQDIAKWDLKTAGRGATVQDVMDKIRPSPKEPELQDKAKAVLEKTLVCLQRFGSVIAQATSAVFGPASQVMNGISFLIDITQEYSKVFSGFVTIMERISAFLGRMRTYLDGKVPAGGVVLDKRLRSDVYDVLQNFILVLAHSHKLSTSKYARAKLIAGLFFFGDDQGVKSALANLEVKIANVSRMEITVILQEVSEAARDVRRVEEKIDRMGEGVLRIEANLVAEQDSRQRKEQSEKNVQRIKEVLRPADHDPWAKIHGNLQSQIVQNTGSWLLEKHTAFQRWMDPKDMPPSVFILSGGEGYGKSCLSSAVVHHLLEKYPKGLSDHRVAVAYYFFQRDTREKSTIDQAVRDVLYQLTQYDSAYGKTMASTLAETQEPTKLLDLWKVFVDGSRSKVNKTFFIILDGVDEPDSETDRPLATIIQSLMSQSTAEGQLQTRLFISGRPAEVQKLEERAGTSIPEVSLGSKPGSTATPVNEDDIIQYISARLKNMDIFSTSANEEVLALQGRIPGELAAGVNGDFVRLSYKLDEISKCTRVRQIEQILSRASETREDAISRQISSLNGSLSKDEIEDLNEILTWLIGAMKVDAVGWVDTECLEGVLLLKTGTPAIVSVEKQIKSKYTSLLDLDKYGFVTLVSDDIREFLLASARETRKFQAPNNEVQTAEVAIVKRVISTFCGDDLYRRFNFETFFESMGGEKAAKIQVEEGIVHLKILQTCLVALCDKANNEDLTSLHEYAAMYFVEHLKHVDMQTLDPPTLKWIRTQLARLLVEQDPIDAWWNEEYLEDSRQDWIEEDEDDEEGTDAQSESKTDDDGSGDDEIEGDDEDYIDIVAKWLRDAPIDGVEPADRSWLLDTLSEDKSSILLLTRVLRRLAERWFGGDPDFETLRCVHALYLRIYSADVPAGSLSELEDLENMIAWARKELTQIQGDAHWNYRAAVTMKSYAYIDKALEYCRKCLEEQPDHFRVRLCMGEALAISGDRSAAFACYQKLDELSKDLRQSDETIEKLYWDEVLPGLANTCEDLDAAEDMQKRLMDHWLSVIEDEVSGEPDDNQYDYYDETVDKVNTFHRVGQAAEKLISIWYEQQNLPAIRTLLESLDRRDTGYSGTRSAGIMQFCSWFEDFHEALRALASDAEAFDFVDQVYASAIETADAINLSRSLALQYFRGLLHWLHGSLVGSQDRAFEVWTKIIETTIPDDANSMCFDMRTKACRELPKALLHRAKAFGPGSIEANSCIAKLESVAERISSVIYDINEDPVLTIGRYYHLAGEEKQAKSALMKRMKDIFKTWDDNASGYFQYLELAHTFTALGDDPNALAAWSQLAPYPRTEPTHHLLETGEEYYPVYDYGQTNGAGSSDGKPPQDSVEEDDEATSGAEAAAADETDSSDSASDRPDVAENGDDTQPAEDTADDINENDAENAEEPSSELSGWLNSTCDGCETTSWSYVDNIYCCRDCLDVQFDSECYPKLKAGLLNKTVCDPSHEFLHIPPFDVKKWEHLSKDNLVEIGDKEIPRLEWLTSIRAEWGVDRETLDRENQILSSVVLIERVWKAFQRRKRQKETEANHETN